MPLRPVFKGNPRSVADLRIYQQTLASWEEGEAMRKADLEEQIELAKTRNNPDAMTFDLAFEERPLPEKVNRGPQGLPGMNGSPGKAGADGLGNVNEILTTVLGVVIVDETGNVVTEGGTAV